MKLNKVFKWCLVALMAISIAVLVYGFVVGFMTNDAAPVDYLFYWAYIMIGLAILSWVLVGGIIMVKNNPKDLIKVGIAAVVLVAIVFVAYLLAPGADAVGREGVDTLSTLKLTDTVLNLTYFAGGAAILAIIIGEIRLAINNRK